ncbi:MAG TPA: AAA family ATPase [Candidatus Saccharimonadales bacterium]|nr:AAA family ATPase [Candidatus Saccharimonadales bacterium]
MNERKEQKTVYQEPLLVIIRGIPGSGKSYLTNDIINKLSIDITIVDPDSINKESKTYKEFAHKLRSTEPEVEEKFYPYRFMLQIAHDRLNQKSKPPFVIWNQAFTDTEGLDYTVRKLKSLCNSQLNILIIQLDPHPEEAWKRIQERMQTGGHGMDSERFNSFVTKYQKIEPQYPNIVVDTFTSYENAVTQAMDQIKQIWTKNEN